MDTQEPVLIEDAVPAELTAFCVLFLDPDETIAVYGALRAYSRALVAEEQLEMASGVLKIMQAIQPMAQQAASFFQSSQTVAPE